MLDRMQTSTTLTINMAKAYVLDNLLDDWLGSVPYMSSKVTIQFSPRSDVTKCKSDTYRISKAGRGRGGGGQGRGRGHGNGGGRGRGNESGKHGPANRYFHGVDCNNYKRKFDNNEFRLIGDDELVFDCRDGDKRRIQQFKLDKTKSDD